MMKWFKDSRFKTNPDYVDFAVFNYKRTNKANCY